jgi:hypothetical protein
MTSQIAISNQTGVVIASDTVTSLSIEGTIQKTINDQQKIWPLWPNNTIAIITSGCTTINGIRKSILITEWKRSSDKTFATVEECAKDFNSWLSNKNQPFNEDSEKNIILELISSHVRKLQETIVQSLKEAELYFSDSDSANQVKILIDSLIAESAETLENLPKYSVFNMDLSKKIIDELFEQIDSLVDEIMWDCLPDSESRNAIQQSLPRLLCTIQEIDDLDANFGFVGFGSKEIFTAISRVSVRGYYCSSMQSVCVSDEAYDQTNPGEVALFAQTDAIRAFANGYHEDVLSQVSSFVIDKLSEHIEDVDKLVEISSEIDELIRDYAVENFTIPLLATIGNLNLNDLAKLADSLIGMQSIKSAASPRPATVGGLIEILLIDREHGFRWFRKLPSRTSQIPVLD